MNKYNLSPKPQMINKNLWYYEEDKGLLFVHRIINDLGRTIITDQFAIPWRKILTSVTRYQKK